MNLRNRFLATAGAVLLVATTTLTGLAQTQQATGNATVSITSDTTTNYLAVSVTNAAFGGYAYSFVDQTAAGSLTVTATDTRGTAAGWNVSLSASDFAAGTERIAIANLALTAGTPSALAFGGSTGSTAGVVATSAAPVQQTGTSTSKILSAGVGSGAGQFQLPMTGALNIPGGTLVGSYTSTVSVAIVSGP